MANLKTVMLTTGLCLASVLLTPTAAAQERGKLREKIQERIESRRTEQPRAAADAASTIQVGGLTRTYLLHVPRTYDKAGPAALVFAFHGGTGRASTMSKITGDLDAVADRHGFIVVYPEGTDKHWNDGRETQPDNTDDVGFISELIDQLAKGYNVDRKRIYATGISNGGMFAQRLACDLSEKIAAIASVAATMPQNLPGRCAPKRPVAVLIMHGTADPLFPYAGGELKGAGKGGYGGKVLSAADAVKFWVTHNKTSASPTVTSLPDIDPQDGTSVKRMTYGNGQEGTEVVLYEIEGGGHTWPGGLQYFPERLIGKVSRDISGNEVIWEFFGKHPMR